MKSELTALTSNWNFKRTALIKLEQTGYVHYGKAVFKQKFILSIINKKTYFQIDWLF